MHFGTPDLRKRVATECLTGEKVICLAITEPYAGSDVANLTTSATKTEDGKHYVVNGEKKWITNGAFADYFTVAVRLRTAFIADLSRFEPAALDRLECLYC
jgi:alkylation response protein AidB-like acyl-CoA dehydrogenase